MHRIICALALTWTSGAVVFAQNPPGPGAAGPLATVKLAQTVLANGAPLSPGTYEIRLTGEALSPLPGQSNGAERRVEFVRNGSVVGREVATVYEPDLAAASPSAATDGARVQLLKGGDFVRVSVVKGGVRYLIHLPVAR